MQHHATLRFVSSLHSRVLLLLLISLCSVPALTRRLSDDVISALINTTDKRSTDAFFVFVVHARSAALERVRRQADPADSQRRSVPDDPVPGGTYSPPWTPSSSPTVPRAHGPDPAQPQHRGVLCWTSPASRRRGCRGTPPTPAAVPHLQARAHEAEVDWILRNSHPTPSTTTLSDAAAGGRLSAQGRNIAERRGDRRTQAAIWHLQRLGTGHPGTTCRPGQQGTPPESPSNSTASASWPATPRRSLTASGATLSCRSRGDGQEWEDVAASMVTIGPGGGEVTRSLGVGSTVSHSRFGRHGGGPATTGCSSPAGRDPR